MSGPVIHSAVATVLAVIMLSFSKFAFIVDYFFVGLMALIGIGVANGLFFFLFFFP